MLTDAANFAELDVRAVRAVRAGEAERYRELVERHERRVYAVAWSRLGDATLAEEATQEAFVRAYRRLWLLRDGAKFAAWIASIARHIAINLGLRHRRELNKRKRWALEQAPAHEDHSDTAEPNAPCSPETLRQTLAGLPASHRECLALFYLEGKSGAEAAAALGISEPALRVRLHRARAALRSRLEEQLGDSLRELGPGRPLVPAIMAGVLATSSAKAATAGGAVGIGAGTQFLAAVGKVVPFAALIPLLEVTIPLPGLLLASWIGRMERRNYREQDGFRARLHRDHYRTLLWRIPLMMLSIVVPIQLARGAWGIRAVAAWLALFLGTLTLIKARSLVIQRNSFQVGMVVYCGVITIGTLALALSWLPPALSSLPIILASVVFIGVLGRNRPVRMDYNLFLRATQNLLETSEVAASSTRKLDRAALLTFARFLGSRWLAANYRWETDGLTLRLPWVKAGFLTNMSGFFVPISPRCSRLLLRTDADVVAHLGEVDAAHLAALFPGDPGTPEELELQVAAAVEHSWHEFRNGNSAFAERAVGERPDTEVYFVSPHRARATRWLRVSMIALVILMAVSMVSVFVRDRQERKARMIIGYRLLPVSFTEPDVRATLAQLEEGGELGNIPLLKVASAFWLSEVLPDEALFTPDGWEVLRGHLLGRRFIESDTAAQRLDRLLGTPDLLRAVVNGWFNPEQFGLTSATIRRVLLDAPDASRNRWFGPEEIAVANREDGTPAGYTVLNTDDLARRVQCLKRFGALDVVDGIPVVETLLRHQVLSEQLPAGRRQLPFPELLHGTFLFHGEDPVRDTYHALVVLESFGALQRMDREACIRGILRFHHGRGLFGSVQQGDGFVISGDSRDTFWAFESLRILDALDRVKDLPHWQFRPMFTSQSVNQPREVGPMTWAEIGAWVCRQRFERFLRELDERAPAPARSLLEP